MFKNKKVKNQLKEDLGNLVDDIIRFVETKHYVNPFNKKEEIQYHKMSADYRETLFILSSYLRSGSEEPIGDWLKEIGHVEKDKIISDGYKGIPNMYYR